MVNEVDPLFSNTWRMQPEASSFSSTFSPETETRLYEALENGYKLSVSRVSAGTDYSWTYTAFYDGARHPVSGREDVDSIEIHRIDQHTTVGFFYQGLSPGGPYRRTVSEDGMNLLVETAGRNSDGSPFYDVINYAIS